MRTQGKSIALGLVLTLAACTSGGHGAPAPPSASPLATSRTVDGTEPVDDAASSTTPAVTEANVTTHVFDLPPFPAIRASTPTTWDAVDGWALVRGPCAETGCTDADTTMAVLFWRVTEVYGESCDWLGTTFDPGPSVGDLAAALQAVPTRNATEPVPVTVGGAEGVYLEWSVPIDADFDACDEGFFESWKGDVGGTDRYQQLPGQVDRIWILDVDGQRLVIDAFYLPATPEVERQEIDDIIASIGFE
jgi:hypothetical protein